MEEGGGGRLSRGPVDDGVKGREWAESGGQARWGRKDRLTGGKTEKIKVSSRK